MKPLNRLPKKAGKKPTGIQRWVNQSAKSLESFIDILKETLEQDGQKLWLLHVQKQLSQGNAEPALLEKGYEEIRNEILGFLDSCRNESWGLRVRHLVGAGISTQGFSQALCLGFLMPKTDIVFYRSNHTRDALTLKNAPLFTTEVILEWAQSVFNQAQITARRRSSAEGLDHFCAALIEVFEKYFEGAVRGLRRGTALQQRTVRPFEKLGILSKRPVRVPLDTKAFDLLRLSLNIETRSKPPSEQGEASS